MLLDLYLNGFEGWNVLQDIKHKDPQTRVLIVTAYDSYANDPRVSQADGYWVKSFVDFDKLKRKISDILERKPDSKFEEIKIEGAALVGGIIMHGPIGR